MADRTQEGLIDLSHVIEEGTTTYKGLPGSHLCDFWTAVPPKVKGMGTFPVRAFARLD